MTPLFLLHLAILFAILYIPFLPQQYLKYAIYVPALLALGWLVLGGCPISMKQPELEGKGFIYHLLKKIFPNVTEKQADNVCTLILVSVTLFACLNLKK
jgi:hypothetical protein